MEGLCALFYELLGRSVFACSNYNFENELLNNKLGWKGSMPYFMSYSNIISEFFWLAPIIILSINNSIKS
jgi:hypothetical protein